MSAFLNYFKKTGKRMQDAKKLFKAWNVMRDMKVMKRKGKNESVM